MIADELIYSITSKITTTRAGTSEKIQPQINANERKSIRNGR